MVLSIAQKCFSCLAAERMIENLAVYSVALKTNSQHVKVNISAWYIIFYYRLIVGTKTSDLGSSGNIEDKSSCHACKIKIG